MIDGYFSQLPVLIMADLDNHWKRFICDHDFVMRGPDLGEVLIFKHVLIHLYMGYRSVLLGYDLSILVLVINTGAAS